MGISRSNKKKWRCRLLIFSGRPDPQWPVSDEQAEGWLNSMVQAPQEKVDVPDASALGYRGVVLYRGNDYYYLFDGHIRYLENEKSVIKADAGRTLENIMLQTAPAEIQKLAREYYK